MLATVAESLNFLNRGMAKHEGARLSSPMMRGWMVGENKADALKKVYGTKMLKGFIEKATQGSKKLPPNLG
jgi:hypothetical protein